MSARRRVARTPSVTNQLVLDAFAQVRDGDPAPVYIQIERCIRLLIADGTLQAGHRLPAVRELAHQLGLAPNTVARAYADLVGEGIMASRAGAGSVVAFRQPPSAGESDRAARERLQRVARHLVAYSLAVGHASGEILHAVRAELAALGRLDAARTEPRVEVRPALPTHPVPATARVSGLHDRLEVQGLVARPVSLSNEDLAQLQRVELEQPFACDEGWVVPSLRWSGVPLAAVLVLAAPLPSAHFVRVGAGTYTLPLSLAETADALLADELDGQPLALEHGAPWRLILPGGACYTSVKWVDRLELMAQPSGIREKG